MAFHFMDELFVFKSYCVVKNMYHFKHMLGIAIE